MKPTTIETKTGRLEPLDLARFLAFAAMVHVNFGLLLQGFSEQTTPTIPIFQGRAAALFVILAGIGFGLQTKKYSTASSTLSILKRSVFLFFVGLLNMVIFEADIIHFYAFYFALGLLFINRSTTLLLTSIILTTFGFVLLTMVFNYDAGWNWQTYTYIDLWTLEGFTRNLWFNGWHPIVPWFSFFLFGMIISRWDLRSTRTQVLMILTGSITAILLSLWAFNLSLQVSQEIQPLLTLAPVPPMPFYIFVSLGVSAAIIGLCFYFEDWLEKYRIIDLLVPAGKQTLTLYLAHILVGMTFFDAMGWSNTQTATSTLLITTIFCCIAIIYAHIWSRRFPRGPIEWLMRYTTK